MMRRAPSTNTISSEPSVAVAELTPPPSPPKQISCSGQGVGVGSAPGRCGSPAETGLDQTPQSSAKPSEIVRASFLNVDSPVIEVIDRGRFATNNVHSTTLTDADLVLFRTLADRKDFDELTRLCRERLLTARDSLTSLRWQKDRAIVEALRGDFIASYDLLNGAHWLASQFEGTPRGKHAHEFAIVHARLGRSSHALNFFNVAFQELRRAGRVLDCASVDTARARALVTRGEAFKALRYLRRAERVATEFGDYRLLADICETRAAAYKELSEVHR